MRWRTVPLKRVASIRVSNVDKKTVAGDMAVRLCNYTDVYYRDTILPDQEFMAATATPDQISTFRLRPGDVLITKDSETADDIGVPAYVAASASDLVCGYHLAIIRPLAGALHGRYLHWAMSSAAIREQLSAAATGITRYGLRSDGIAMTELALPEPEQQQAIADFLDAETARIDALIAKRRELAGLLSERWRAEVERRIIEASNGQIQFRRLLRKPPQYGLGESGVAGPDDWPRYIRITDLRMDGSLREDDVKRLSPEVALPFLLHEGDLLFARSGATSGKAFRYREFMGKACFAGYLIRFRINRSRALPRFVELWSQTRQYWGQVHALAVQSTIQNVSAERYLDFAVPNVPIDQQTMLINDAAGVRDAAEAASIALDRQVELLKERRIALITAAVTGELAIPEAAA